MTAARRILVRAALNEALQHRGKAAMLRERGWIADAECHRRQAAKALAMAKRLRAQA